MKSLGTAACPPYHIAFVIGGTSAEKNLLTVKLASIKYYDSLPTTGDETGRAFRDIDLEQKLLVEAQKIGLGAQFGGKYLAHDIRVIRLPRHGASCPIGMGVSCSADRNIKAKINADGIWLEKMDNNPSELIPAEYAKAGEGPNTIEINLNEGIDAVRKELSKYPVSTRVNLKGTIIVARDIAHAKLKARIDAGEPMPEYFKKYPVLYAGPAKTPEGYPCGSMGPTTANRMDPYVDEFQSLGASLVMIAKGNRSQVVTDACRSRASRVSNVWNIPNSAWRLSGRLTLRTSRHSYLSMIRAMTFSRHLNHGLHAPSNPSAVGASVLPLVASAPGRSCPG